MDKLVPLLRIGVRVGAPDAEYAIDFGGRDADVVGGSVGTLVFDGASPGMLIGKQSEKRGSLQLKSCFCQPVWRVPMLPLRFRSTSMPMELFSLMPVVDEPGV